MNNMKIKIDKAAIFITITIIFIALRDCAKASIDFSMFSGMCIIAGIIMNRKERFLYIFSLLPFSRGLPYSEMILLLLVIEIIDSTLIKRNCRINAKLYMPILGIVIIELLDYIKFDVVSNEIIYLVCYMLVATWAIDFHVFEKKGEKFIYGYSIGTICAVLLVVVREINELGLDYIFTYNIRFGANTAGRIVTNFNSNELGLYCIVALCLLLTLKHEKNTKLPFIMAVIVTSVGLVSISRTFIMLAVISWVIYVVLSKKPVKSVVVVICVFAFTFVLANVLIPDFITWIEDYFISRSQTSDGRLNLVQDYFNWSFASLWTLLLGYSELYPVILNSVASHNGIQEMFVCWGIVGALVGLSWIYMLVHEASKGRKKKLFNWIPFLIFMTFIQSVQLFTMHGYLLVMVITLVSIDGIGGRNIGLAIKGTY